MDELHAIYDKLCTALTKAEQTEEFPDYTYDCFYEDIVEAVNKLAEIIN